MVYSANLYGLCEKLRKVLQIAGGSRLKLKKDNIEFSVSKFQYLGQIISHNDIFPNPKKISSY